MAGAMAAAVSSTRKSTRAQQQQPLFRQLAVKCVHAAELPTSRTKIDAVDHASPLGGDVIAADNLH